MKNAAVSAHEEAMYIFEEYVDQYYDEYEPKIYVRTRQLGTERRSYVDRGALYEVRPFKYSFGTGYGSVIKFEPRLMNHSKKRMRGANGKIYVYDNSGWSEEKILHEAMVGETHGGYKNPSGENTPIFTYALNDFHGGINTNLVSHMIRNLNIKFRY